ncbi:MAG: 2-amino-4-hydroxy-6-hydroxymethyldihydropteridine diphosphokinase [Limisphaerales bacterium]|jgi:2-amino-4-hydroxy-6-hydroxymethyldihydropteridine diphosphokinase
MGDRMNELIVVALGSNLGESETIIPDAMDRLEALGASPYLRSSLWRSSPVDCPPGSPDFINAVVAFSSGTITDPDAFLEVLQGMEREFGRQTKKVVNEARPLDLDLIAFKAEKCSLARLTLPHPRAHLRRFVLAPLAEILPGFEAPGWELTAAGFLRDIAGDELVERIVG